MAIWRRKKIARDMQSPSPVPAGPSTPEEEEAQTTEMPPRHRWSRKRKGLAVFVVVIVVALLAVNATSLQGVIFPRHSLYRILRVDSSNTYADLLSLTAIGPRLTGTPGELAGAEYIAGVFRSSGLTGVEIQEYYVTCYEVDRASLALVQYTKGPFGLFPNPTVSPEEFAHKTDFVVGAYSGSYSFSRWTDDVEMVSVGNGSDSSLYSSASGKAVIATNDGDIGNTRLYIQAWEAGAAASIIYNVAMDTQIGCPAVSYSVDGVDSSGHTIPLPDNYSGNGPDIPNMMVSKNTGELLIDGITAQSRLRMDIHVTIEKRPCRVVVGDRKGTVHPDKIIMVGAHHDTTYLSSGAVDNTAGTAGLLGIAREIGQLNPQKTVRFATFGGEEEGLLGSYEYFKAYSSRLRGNLEMMLNMDMCNIDTKRAHDLPIVVSDKQYLSVLEGIKAEANRQITQMSGYNVQFYQGNLTSSSDMATFSIEHYKVASCWGSGSYEYHSTKDTADHINPESFLVVGAVYGSFAYYLAGGKP